MQRHASARAMNGTGLPRGLAVALFAAYAANTLDRQVLGILLEPIRHELLLSDAQLGVLTGIAYAIVFAIAAIPAALWSSFGNRSVLVAVSALVWSAMMMAGGFATSFWQLLAARAGVALGEAGSVPASHAILSDAAREGRRTGTLAAFTAAAPVGVLAAFLLGGVLGRYFGWRTAMMVAGVPGLVIGLYMLRFAREGRSVSSRPTSAADALDIGNLLQAFREILGQSGARNALIAAWLNAIVLNAALVWYPSFLVRLHGFSLLQVGVILAAGSMLGMAGTLLLGRLIDRLSLKRPAWQAWVPALSILLATPFDLVFLMSPDRVVSLVAFGVSTAVAAVMIAPTVAILHAAVAPPRRTIASAIFLSGGGLLGAGLGPWVVGWLSGQVFAATGVESLRYALVWMQIFGALASPFYFLSGRALAGRRPAQSRG